MLVEMRVAGLRFVLILFSCVFYNGLQIFHSLNKLMDSIHAHYVTRKYLAYVQLCIDLKSFPEEDGLCLVQNCKDSIC